MPSEFAGEAQRGDESPLRANCANRQPPGTPLDTLSDFLGVLPSVAPDGHTDTLVHPSGASGPPGVIASASSAAHPKIEARPLRAVAGASEQPICGTYRQFVCSRGCCWLKESEIRLCGLHCHDARRRGGKGPTIGGRSPLGTFPGRLEFCHHRTPSDADLLLVGMGGMLTRWLPI